MTADEENRMKGRKVWRSDKKGREIMRNTILHLVLWGLMGTI